MITRTASRWQTNDWQSALKNSIRSLDALCQALNLTPEDLPACYRASEDFPVKVPPGYLQRIEKGNPHDPLLLQVLPQAAETIEQTGFIDDPLQEQTYNPVPGLIHKYPGRVLLISNPNCVIHCRYCFRRHFPYSQNTPGRKNWQAALDYIATDTSIHEVILSGGDPLSANDDYLQQLIDDISRIRHIHTLRLHSRIPSVMPERITDNLLQILAGTRLKPVMVLHINHANELSGDVLDAVQLLQQAGLRLYNQSVLLKGINDSETAQLELLQRLHQLDIQAYYLHVMDKVRGTAHFVLADDDAQQLYQQLLQQLPGYMLPRLVREIPERTSKTPLIPLLNKD